MKTKTRKTTRILCASSIAAMTLLGSVAPALTTVAAEGSTTAAVGDTSSTTTTNQIPFDKTILLDENENVPNATIRYQVVGKDVTHDDEALKAQYYNVKKGPVSLSAKDTVFDADDTVSTEGNTRSITKRSTIDASNLFTGDTKPTQPTVYTYTLSEEVQGDANNFVKPNVDGGDKRNLYIFVGYDDDDNLSVLGSLITPEGKTPELEDSVAKNKVTGFENKYLTSDNEDTKAIKVTKKVTGNQGDKTAKFNFTVEITGQHSKVTATTTGDKNDLTTTTPTTTDSKVTVKATLTDGQSLTLRGLTKGAKYTVAEDDANQNGYTTTPADPTTGETAETVVTNDRTGTIPTGIYLNHKLPFNILGVALAGGAVALIAKKRHEDVLEDEDDE